jgi:hypothetical protein
MEKKELLILIVKRSQVVDISEFQMRLPGLLQNFGKATFPEKTPDNQLTS